VKALKPQPEEDLKKEANYESAFERVKVSLKTEKVSSD
jgi:hypothetical protein